MNILPDAGALIAVLSGLTEKHLPTNKFKRYENLLFTRALRQGRTVCKSINDKTLENCLERLKQWEKNENRPCEIELYYDHAPYSFGFCERYPDGNTGIVGGLLYHGNPDESFAVTMERFHGWSIHT